MANVSGTVYVDRGVTPMGAGRTLNYSLNGAASSGSTTTASDGTYTIAGVTTTNNTVIAVYLQGNTEAAATITVGGGADITGVDLWQDCLLLFNNGKTLSNTLIGTSDNNGATGLSAIYAANATTSLTMAVGKSLVVMTGQTVTQFPTTVTLNGGDLVCNGSVTIWQTLSLTGTGGSVKSTGQILSLVVNSSGTYTLAGQMGTAALTLTAGTLDVSTSNYQLLVSGAWTVTAGTFLCRQGTVLRGRSGSDLVGGPSTEGPFWNLTKTGSAKFTMAGDTTVSGNFTISAGTWDMSSHVLAVAGNFDTSGGTFTASTGTVNLTGAGGTTQTLSGSTTFYNLSVTTSAARTIAFTDGTTQTVTNSLTLQGASGQLLTLAGTSTGGWTIAVPVTQTIDHVSVSYSTATGNTAAAGSTSTDGGHNTGWTFASGSVVVPRMRTRGGRRLSRMSRL